MIENVIKLLLIIIEIEIISVDDITNFPNISSSKRCFLS
jgi:hypothetical protein